MNVGIFSGAGSAGAMSGAYSRTDVVLPDAREAGLASETGRGASVEVSLSPQATSLLTIDMDSLAAKGYDEVNIDTDGQPGAEISIKVQPGAGQVAVGTESTLQELRELADGADAEGLLLQILLQASAEEGSDASDKDEPVPLVQIALRAYNDAAQA